jgi:hypothetical protein
MELLLALAVWHIKRAELARRTVFCSSMIQGHIAAVLSERDGKIGAEMAFFGEHCLDFTVRHVDCIPFGDVNF